MRITSTVSQIVIEWDPEHFGVSPHSLAVLKKSLSSMQEIQSVKLSGTKQKRIVVAYRSPQGVVEFLRKVTHTIRSAQVDHMNLENKVDGVETRKSAELTRSKSIFGRLSQGVYGVLASGSFVMAWVGLILPGIPTVPFVILTVYFAEKVSPTFRKKLMDAPVIGPAMQDWSENRAIRRSVRNRVYLLLSAMILIALLLTPIDSIQFVSVILMAGLSIYMMNRIPVIEDPLPNNQTAILVA